MMYQVFYRTPQDGRAPSTIKLTEYEEGPELEIVSKHSAPVAISKITDEATAKNRAIRVGDVLRDDNDNYFIYTPTFQWALVQTVD